MFDALHTIKPYPMDRMWELRRLLTAGCWTRHLGLCERLRSAAARRCCDGPLPTSLTYLDLTRCLYYMT